MASFSRRVVYPKSRFRVKRPIRSFLDLEVYQRTQAAATEVMTKILPLIGADGVPLKEKLMTCCLAIPEAIAGAHSRRFEAGVGVGGLEEALEGCNRAVVYLEQVREIFLREPEGRAVCEDVVTRYLLARRKILNLSRAWQRFASRDEAPHTPVRGSER